MATVEEKKIEEQKTVEVEPVKKTTKKGRKSTKKSNKKTTKKSSNKKTKKEEPVEEKKEEPVEEKKEEPVVEKKEEKTKSLTRSEELVKTVDEGFESIIMKHKEMTKMFREQIQDAKSLQNKVHKMTKSLRKEKRNKRDQKSKPSGFNKPIKVSPELEVFLGIKQDELIARTTVTKLVHDYIKGQQLKDEKDGRIIRADEKLKTLLKLQGDNELTYFNLQKYLNVHFN